MIRLATTADLPALMSMATKFVEHSKSHKYTSEERIYHIMSNLIQSPEGIVMIDDEGGFLLGTVITTMFGDTRQACELAWWVEPDARSKGVGRELLKKFEDWAWFQGCKLVSMSAIDESVTEVYKKYGYVQSDATFIKEL